MTATQKTVLGCLAANVGAAKTRAMRRFAQGQLDGYRSRLNARQASRQTYCPGPAWDRVIEPNSQADPPA